MLESKQEWIEENIRNWDDLVIWVKAELPKNTEDVTKHNLIGCAKALPRQLALKCRRDPSTGQNGGIVHALKGSVETLKQDVLSLMSEYSRVQDIDNRVTKLEQELKKLNEKLNAVESTVSKVNQALPPFSPRLKA